MELLLLVLLIGFIVGIVPFALLFWFDVRKYNASNYKAETGEPYRAVRFDKGLNGEYLTSNVLDKVDGHHRTVLNCYLSNTRGQLTEVDLIFIHETGIYVVESKNYSGWIFGRERDKNWTQSFPNRRKQSFYNPIKQNTTHLNAVKKSLPQVPVDAFMSLIVFSERCELKKVTVDSDHVRVLKRDALRSLMKETVRGRDKVLTVEQVDAVYTLLKVHAQVDESVKRAHIDRVSQYKK